MLLLSLDGQLREGEVQDRVELVMNVICEIQEVYQVKKLHYGHP